MKCLIKIDEPTTRPELCENCFNDENVLHDHKEFCKIDSKGYHTFARRDVGFCESSFKLINFY